MIVAFFASGTGKLSGSMPASCEDPEMNLLQAGIPNKLALDVVRPGLMHTALSD